MLVLGVLSASLFPAFGQFRGGVQGTVTDASGGIVPGANITLVDNETQRKLETKSNDSGTYTFTNLAPARYTVRTTIKGFKEISTDVTVNAEAIQTADVVLQAGDVAETVTVVADSSPAIETTNGNVARSLTNQEILRLPQSGRDPYELLRLTPGIFGNGARSGNGQSIPFPNAGGTSGGAGPGGSNFSLFQVENQVPISADGQRITSNNYLLDGVSVNSLQWGGAAVVTPNQESVKEIKVNANAYSAEYGRNSGAQIETVSQNGTNQFHGSALFLFQDPNFNAYNKTSLPSIAVTRNDENARNYAGSIGGPIKKDHLFFFFSTEGIHDYNTSFVQAYVETPQFDQALINQRPGSIAAKIVGSPGNAPRVAGVLPLPSCPAGQLPNCQVVNGELDLGTFGGSVGTYLNPNPAAGQRNLTPPDGIPDVEYANIALPTKNTGNQYNGRLDWSGSKDYIAGSIYYTTSNQQGSNGVGRPNTDTVASPLNADVTVIYTRTISSRLVNEARGNFTRFGYNQLSSLGPANLAIPEIDIQFPAIAQFTYGVGRSDSTPGKFAQNTYEFRDSLGAVFGNHNLRMGVEYRREQDNNNLPGGARPVYSFQSLWNFANDQPIYEGITANAITGGNPLTQYYFRTNVYGTYLQDDWKVTPKLTVNLGVRWEYFTPLSEKNNALYNFVYGPGLGNLTGASLQRESQVHKPQYGNVAPRFGFAYNPVTRLVMRGGFGMMYNRTEDALFALARQDNPQSQTFGFCCSGLTATPASVNILYSLGSSNSVFSYPANPATAQGLNPLTNTPNGTTVQVYGTPNYFPTTYAYIYSFEADYNMGRSYVLTVGYQGSDTKHLNHIVDLKFLYPVSGVAASNFSDIFSIQPDAISNYNALNVTLSKPLANGVQFQQNFRWAKSMDNNSSEGPGGGTNPTYPTDFHQEYGPSDFDVKYTYTASGLYELPFFRHGNSLFARALGGWRINTIFTFNTGFPWTPKSGQALQTPTGAGLSPTRPYEYLGGALTGQSNDSFLRPNGNFPGGGSKYFLYTYPSGLTTLPPGIGRNVFRGPWYKDVDFSVSKTTRLPNRFLGEASALDLRLNIFNAFNQQNFQSFNFGDASTFVDNPLFGQPIHELAGRALELQARFSF